MLVAGSPRNIFFISPRNEISPISIFIEGKKNMIFYDDLPFYILKEEIWEKWEGEMYIAGKMYTPDAWLFIYKGSNYSRSIDLPINLPDFKRKSGRKTALVEITVH